jgi:hypothetical protein
MQLPPVSAGFRRLAHLRRARAFHPVGRVGQGRLVLDSDDSALGRALGEGEHTATVRLSRGIGLPGRFPDMLGLAIRIAAQDGEPFDLLLTTTARPGWARWAVLPASRWTSRPYSTVMPYDTGDGHTLVALAPLTDATPGSSPEALDAISEEQPLTFAVLESGHGWRAVGRLVIHRIGTDESIAFDPMLHARPSLRPVRPLATLREAAYRGSRRGRQD